MSTPRLAEKYRKEVIPVLKKEFWIDNPMAVPKVEKVVLNMGIGEAITNAKLVYTAAEELTKIAGQRAVVTKAKKSIATFKLRAGMPIGCRVTLRGDRMYEFLDRLMNVALPRVRDFRGVPTRAFDGRGNYTLGVKDHLIFPEIDPTKIDKSKGLNVTIVTTAGSDDRARVLLKELGMPFGRYQVKERRHCSSRRDHQGEFETEVRDPQAKPLHALRASAGVSPQVRLVPHLLPEPRARGLRARSDEGVVVRRGR